MALPAVTEDLYFGGVRRSNRTRARAQRKGAQAATASAAGLIAAALVLGAGGCTEQQPAGPAPNAGDLLNAAAGRLDGESTFRLTLDTKVPPPSTATAAPTAAASPAPGPAPGTLNSVKMSGVWDTATGMARMDGTLNAVSTTILSANGVEYVSLTAAMVKAEGGKKWLKSDNGDATFGDFDDPHVVAQLLRAYHEVHAVDPHHLAGTLLTSEADEHIGDPNLISSLAQYPDTIRFEVWTDGTGAPTEVLFTLAGGGAVTTGTAKLDSFGTAPPNVSIPTIDQVAEAPVG